MKTFWGVAVVVAALSAGPCFAGATIAGGKLDSSVSGAEVYLAAPKAGSVPPGAACRATKKYVDLIQAGRYAEVANLFADDAVVLEPTRQDTVGHDKIAAFYEHTIGPMKPEIVAVSYVGDKTDCIVTLASRAPVGGHPRYKLSSADHFTLNSAGKFSRMVAFVRPGPPAAK